MNQNFFKNINCVEELKEQYKRLCFRIHPDLIQDQEEKIARTAMMQELNSQYEKLFNQVKNVYRNKEGVVYTTTKTTNEVPADFINIINKIIGFHNCKVELCGRWIWVTGDTKPYKNELKGLGFFWNAKKVAWSWHHPQDVSFSKGKYNMDEIRYMFGSETIEERQALTA